jgi:hypothetical protein
MAAEGNMFVRIGAALLALFYGGNGLWMLAAPRGWFAQVSRNDPIGAYNWHLVTDVGLAFLAAGFAFLAYAWRVEWRLMAFGASGFILFHALFHVLEYVGHGDGDPRTLGVIVLPALLGVAISWPRRGEA